MRVKIKSHSIDYSFMRWWYADHIREDFEVYPDPKMDQYYLTDIEYKGKIERRHILKRDTEIVTTVPSLGHGEIVRGEDGQLKDDLSRLWCACGNPAIIYRQENDPPHQFLCFEHLPKASESNESA